MRRRALLRTVGTAAAVGLAGCVGGRRDPSGGTPHETPAEPTATFEVTDAGCGQQVSRATVSADDGTVTVEGTAWGNDACYTARLESVIRDGPRLAVAVVTERDAPPDQACAECIAEIDYRVTVDVASRPETVVVTHDGETVAETSP